MAALAYRSTSLPARFASLSLIVSPDLTVRDKCTPPSISTRSMLPSLRRKVASRYRHRPPLSIRRWHCGAEVHGGGRTGGTRPPTAPPLRRTDHWPAPAAPVGIGLDPSPAARPSVGRGESCAAERVPRKRGRPSIGPVPTPRRPVSSGATR